MNFPSLALRDQLFFLSITSANNYISFSTFIAYECYRKGAIALIKVYTIFLFDPEYSIGNSVYFIIDMIIILSEHLEFHSYGKSASNYLGKILVTRKALCLQ